MRTLAHKWARSCEGKVRHTTEQAAQQEVMRMSRLDKDKFKYYRCECCSGYHVAHVQSKTHSMHFR